MAMFLVLSCSNELPSDLGSLLHADRSCLAKSGTVIPLENIATTVHKKALECTVT